MPIPIPIHIVVHLYLHCTRDAPTRNAHDSKLSMGARLYKGSQQWYTALRSTYSNALLVATAGGDSLGVMTRHICIDIYKDNIY